jgi:hypothetical protein
MHIVEMKYPAVRIERRGYQAKAPHYGTGSEPSIQGIEVLHSIQEWKNRRAGPHGRRE